MCVCVCLCGRGVAVACRVLDMPPAAPQAPPRRQRFLTSPRPSHHPAPPQTGQMAGKEGQGASEMERHGLQYVRGCEVVEIRDEGAPPPRAWPVAAAARLLPASVFAPREGIWMHACLGGGGGGPSGLSTALASLALP